MLKINNKDCSALCCMYVTLKQWNKSSQFYPHNLFATNPEKNPHDLPTIQEKTHSLYFNSWNILAEARMLIIYENLNADVRNGRYIL